VPDVNKLLDHVACGVLSDLNVFRSLRKVVGKEDRVTASAE
jgi:hypothetical protein